MVRGMAFIGRSFMGSRPQLVDRRVARPDAAARVGASFCPSLDVVAVRAPFGLVALECLPLAFNVERGSPRLFLYPLPMLAAKLRSKKTSPAQVEVKWHILNLTSPQKYVQRSEPWEHQS